MNIASTQEIKEAEDCLIQNGVSAEELMEQAGLAIARLIEKEYPLQGLCVAYLGKGNNAGDALVVLRHLRDMGWRIAVRRAYGREEGTSLYQKQWKRLPEVEDWDYGRFSEEEGTVVLLDGLLGLGARGALRPPLDELAGEINKCRCEYGARVVGIDGPSGVDADTGEIYPHAVVADMTAMIAAAKQGFLADSATSHVGRICPVFLPELSVPENSSGKVFDVLMARRRLSPRPYELFKGSAGRVSVIAGSPGMIGAARLCSEAALRSGAGLVTLFALPEVYSFLVTTVSPEIMVKPVRSYVEVSEVAADALIIGPGLGRPEGDREDELLNLIRNYRGKLILDADGLNLISRMRSQSLFRETHLITPHVGEMERLLPRQGRETRCDWVRRSMRLSPVALLLKGARTITGQRGKGLIYNSTGGPGMATAGQGDVLTGVCAGLCAQGLSPYDAGALGAWICGRASDLALREGESEQTLTASCTIAHLRSAFQFKA